MGTRGAVARNLLKAWLLVLVVATAFAGVGWLVAERRGAMLFGFCSLLGATAVWAVGDRALLGMLGARPLADAELPALRPTVERLATTMRLTPPRLYLLPEGLPRAFVAGRGPRSSALAVNHALVVAVRPEELRSLLAHELAHVRSRDVLTQTFAVLLASTLLELTRVGGWLSRGLLAILAPIAAAFTHLLLSPRRELAADAVAARLTDPDDLADALTRLDRAAELVDFAASPATEPLYPVNPFDTDDRVARMFVTHPPLETRIHRLRGFAAQGGASPTRSRTPGSG